MGYRGSRRPELEERDMRAVELRRVGLTYQQIADQMGIDRATVLDSVKRGLHTLYDEAAEEVRKIEMIRLDDLTRVAQTIMTRRHPLVSQGKVIVHPETKEVVLDPMPVLYAIDRMIRIQERRAKLLGLDAPTKIHAEVRNVEAIDAEIERLMAELECQREGKTPPAIESGARTSSQSMAQESASQAIAP